MDVPIRPPVVTPRIVAFVKLTLVRVAFVKMELVRFVPTKVADIRFLPVKLEFGIERPL